MVLIRRFFLLSLLVVACAGASAAHAAGRVLIATSVELQPAMQQLVADFRRQSGAPADGTEIVLTLGSSRDLYADIKRGVPIDLFFAANLNYPARVADDGLAAALPVIYARNELLLWTLLPGTAPSLDLLAERRVHVVAIPSKYSSPFGQRAEQALREAHLWSALQAKLVTGDSVVDVARFVKNGSASAGIVTRSVLHRSEFAGIGSFSPVPAELYKPISQAFVLTRHGEANPVARSFAAFVTSSAAREVFERFGYLPPDAESTAGR